MYVIASAILQGGMRLLIIIFYCKEILLFINEPCEVQYP